MTVGAPLVRAEGLSRSFTRGGRLLGRGVPLLAVQNIDFAIRRGEAVGVVGESGCGKSTLGRLLLRLLPPSNGRVLFEDADLATLSHAKLRRLRRRMQMVFQDPYASLDPRRSVGAQIADGLTVHRLVAPKDAADRVAALLRQVQLDPSYAARLPHQFSGGQRQRVAIARALATQPDFVVADEPVSALDVSVQAQIVNLLADLRSELGLALVFISHDLHVVRHLCDRIVVMYLGRIVEQGPARAVFDAPAHPYTRALLAATPSLHRRVRTAPLAGELPSASKPPSGCVFRTRCPDARPRCADAVPQLEPASGDGTRQVACWRNGEPTA
ncbi:peptide/nickel transport system ATP-binding protein [Enhydrobacter aerosaccus]|uniref:Peptide/nickel transport system ATP-binding protein n=1 Tax=Enhydrobacter aerosaccus TaxID=225324 RepID=A0A1T4K6R2_9HYPH|nr:oligopeptide/dipeptide ABC transporter ATP-binding protein [Enhydrobacter aerosaccus]SJZ38130.1 peptide/nickel transport system ATP-binding protein [Enhydrobacter aerosaccus]